MFPPANQLVLSLPCPHSTPDSLGGYLSLDRELASQRPLEGYVHTGCVGQSYTHTHKHSTRSAGRARGCGQAFWNQFHALEHDKQPQRVTPMEGADGLGYLGDASVPGKESLASGAVSTPAFSLYTAPRESDPHVLSCTFLGTDKTYTSPILRQPIASHQMGPWVAPDRKHLTHYLSLQCWTTNRARPPGCQPQPTSHYLCDPRQAT